jgi:hypothetical protein
MKNLFYLLFVFYGFGCSSSRESFKKQKYFSIDSLITAQISLLESNQKVLTKTVQIDKNIETQTLSVQNIDWQSELKIFRLLELNKSIFIGSIDTKTDFKNTSYRPKKNMDLPIKFLKITKAKGELKSINGYYLDNKAAIIYTSEKSFKMNFNEGLLTNFEISGSQKIIFTDTTRFKINYTIN